MGRRQDSLQRPLAAQDETPWWDPEYEWVPVEDRVERCANDTLEPARELPNLEILDIRFSDVRDQGAPGVFLADAALAVPGQVVDDDPRVGGELPAHGAPASCKNRSRVLTATLSRTSAAMSSVLCFRYLT